MEKGIYYSITTKCFLLRCNHPQWIKETQDLYNRIMLFYYKLFLEQESIQSMNSYQMLRALEKLTVLGRDKTPVPYPLIWKNIPLYFRRAAINAAIAAGKSYLVRASQQQQTEQFSKAATFYKGMYRELTESSIELKVWDGEKWKWLHCRLANNKLPEVGEVLSPSVVIRDREIQLHIPVRQPVKDGRKARERILDNTNICSIQFTNTDSIVVCVIMDGEGRQRSIHFLKGGKEYVHRCRMVQDRLEKSLPSTLGGHNPDANKKYWRKLQNLSNFFSNNISRQIINIILSEGVGIIVLPEYDKDYSGMIMKKAGAWSSLRLSYRIREQLVYKGWREGIVVLEISAYGISSFCAICGAVIRKDGQEYQCSNGHRGNRYVNAARNLGHACLRGFGKQVPKREDAGTVL